MPDLRDHRVMRRLVPWLVVAAAISVVIAAAWWIDTARTPTTPTTVPTPAAQLAPEEPR